MKKVILVLVSLILLSVIVGVVAYTRSQRRENYFIFFSGLHFQGASSGYDRSMSLFNRYHAVFTHIPHLIEDAQSYLQGCSANE